jgi:hypothetical protein
MIDIKGKKYGRLTVLEFSHLNNSRHAVWKCLCECGKLTHGESRFLRNGLKTSCGCNQYRIGKDNKGWRGYEEISLSYFNKIKHDAKKRGLSFDIDIKFIWDLFIKQNKRCALSDEIIDVGSGSKTKNNRTASLDRIDSNRGYTKDNVQWVTTNVNTMKWDLTQERFLSLVKKIYVKNFLT